MAYKRKTEDVFFSPVEYGLYVFGGKWDTRVLGILHIYDTLRYKEIMDRLPGITNPILSGVLKKFQEEGIITRTQYDEIPPRVEYSLTKKGWELVLVLQQVCFWADKYHYRFPEHESEYCRDCKSIKEQQQNGYEDLNWHCAKYRPELCDQEDDT